MTVRSRLLALTQQEDLNFLLTNRIPRRLLTRFMGWFSRIEQPLVRDASIAIWRTFCDVDLANAKKESFRSMHDCFVRELKDGARPVDPDPAVLVSPCDAIVGACGAVDGTKAFQAKGFPFTLEELFGGDRDATEAHRNGCYAILRLTAGMYHRFHAPYDCEVRDVTYISGDTWNVNPIALRRVERLFCRNERAVLRATLEPDGEMVTLVAVAAILVAGIRLRFVDVVPHLRRRGLNRISCCATLRKGEEMGWFEHGSTIIVFAPARFELCDQVGDGARIRMGEPLLRLRKH
jgi:phosphatidylserine decarboxylase